MKTDDQKDEYAQRVNHEKEDRAALLERALKRPVTIEPCPRVGIAIVNADGSHPSLDEILAAINTAPSQAMDWKAEAERFRADFGKETLLTSGWAKRAGDLWELAIELKKHAAEAQKLYGVHAEELIAHAEKVLSAVNSNGTPILSTPAPSGCAEAGERVPEWTVDAVEYDKLYLAACALRSACKSRLPPGHYAKLDEECASIDAIRNAPKHETPAEFLPRPSPSPAGGADGERVDWLEENVETHWPFKCAYTFWVNVETQEPFLVRPTVRQAIDAAIHAATQATPAKDSK